MLQAAVFDCPFLDLFPFSQNGFIAAQVDVSWCDVVQALVETLVVVSSTKDLIWRSGLQGRW